MLEKYAMKNSTPLLATFESESLYKYVEDRYVEVLKNVPKTWIVGNFNKFLSIYQSQEFSSRNKLLLSLLVDNTKLLFWTFKNNIL